MGRRKQKAQPPIKVLGIAYVKRYLLGDGRVQLVYTGDGGKPVRVRFRDAKKAAEEGLRIAQELHNGGREAVVLSPEARTLAVLAARDVEPWGVNVHQAT